MSGLTWLLLAPLGAGAGLVIWLAVSLREPVLAANRRDWLTQKTRQITWRRGLRLTRAHHAELDRLRDDAEADRRQLLARLGHARQEAAAWRESAESLVVQVARLTAERDALTSEHDALICDTATATLAAQRAEQASKEAEARSLPALVGSPALCLDLTAGWADSVMSDAEWAALLAPRAEHDGVPARVTDGGGQLAGKGAGGEACGVARLPARNRRQRARDALLAEMTSRLSVGEAESRGQATPDDPPASAGDGSPSQSPAASQAGTPEDPPKQGDDGVPQDGEHHPPAVLVTSPAAHPLDDGGAVR